MPSFEVWQRTPERPLGFLVNKPTLEEARRLAADYSGLPIENVGLKPTAPDQPAPKRRAA